MFQGVSEQETDGKIGSITNDRNSYGQYGKNVLQVMENIKKGAHTIIVNEEDLPLDLL